MRDTLSAAEVEALRMRLTSLERGLERQAAVIERLCAVLTGHEATLVKLELAAKANYKTDGPEL